MSELREYLRKQAKDIATFGGDRIGPHHYRQHVNPGIRCSCCWSSAYHGDRCPEHGYKGLVVTKTVTTTVRIVGEGVDESFTFGGGA